MWKLLQGFDAIYSLSYKFNSLCLRHIHFSFFCSIYRMPSILRREAEKLKKHLLFPVYYLSSLFSADQKGYLSSDS